MSFQHSNVYIRLISFISLALFCCTSSACTSADVEKTLFQIETFEELEEAIGIARKQLELNPRDAKTHCLLAELMILDGQYQAETYLLQALEIDPTNLNCLIALSELYRRKHQFQEGERILERAVNLAPDEKSVSLLQARFAIDRMDYPTAESIYSNLLKTHPDSPETLIGLAEVLYELQNFEAAEALINQCLEINLNFAPAYSLASLIYRRNQATNEWKESVRKAVVLDPFDAEARVRLAFVLSRLEGKIQEGYQEVTTALRLDPFLRSAYSFLGNGGTPFDYVEQEIEADDPTVAKIVTFLEEGDMHLLKGEYLEAEEAFQEALHLHPENITALMGMGTVNYHLANYDEAMSWFRNVLDINFDYGLAHYGMSQSLLRMRDGYNIRLAEMEAKFALMDAPEHPYLRDVFINYDELDPELKKIVRLSVAPLSNFLKPLSIAGATFYLLPFHKFLWESPHHAHMKGRRTFDLRLWDDIKGLGGFHAIAGADWQRDFKYFRTNVLLHEFTHQVHMILTREQNEEIRRLFHQAKIERRTLGYYADYNEFEYFAVGVPAYAAEETLGVGYTRDDLLEIDPDLYHFVENINRLDCYRENEIAAHIRRGRDFLRDGHIDKTIAHYEEVLSSYGNHPDLLDALGNTYRIKGDYEQAVTTHQQAIQEFPESVSGYIGLADDMFFLDQRDSGAIEILEEVERKHPESFELFFRLGFFHEQRGDVVNMHHYIQTALNIDPYSAAAYHAMARGYLLKENYLDAERYYFKGMDISKSSAAAWAELAYLYLKTGRIEEGEEHLGTALALSKTIPKVRETQAIFLAHEGDLQEARNVLEEMMEEDPMRLETRLQLATLLREAEWERAMEILEEGLTIVLERGPVEFIYRNLTFEPRGLVAQPVVSKFFACYASFLEERQDNEGAIEYYQRAVETFHYNYSSAVSLIALLLQADRYVEAREVYDNLKNTSPPELYLQQIEGYFTDRSEGIEDDQYLYAAVKLD